MKIKKLKGTYNDYSLELSYGQIMAIRNALGQEHADPVSDELYMELGWYLDNIPGPGEDEEDLKKAEEAADSGLDSPEAENRPEKPNADDLLPMPSDEPHVPGENGPEGENLNEPAGPEDEESPSEADRRLPPPPED
jgi:hypothetical protein